MKKLCLLALALATLAPAVRADEVTDWNQMLFRSGIMTNPATSPLVTSRVAAIFSAAVFDAINDGRYAPIHVTPAAPAGASRRAAAVEAAYTVITLLYPTLQYPSLQGAIDLRRQGALAVIAADPRETTQSIQDGKDWGKAVATAIVDWRKADGFAPPCAPGPVTGGTAVGQWRPTPPGYLPGAGPQFACMTPWALTSPGQFAPPGPPALTSDRYAKDFNETKSMGNLTSPLRSADQTTYALFWASTTASYFWNRIAVSLLQGGEDDHHGSRSASAHHSSRLLENARVLALLNMATADAAIACWQAKYYQDAVRLPFWRPITAIPLADTDGNPATAADASWVPLITTPNHPEYPSGHSTLSASAATVLARFFGAKAHFTVDSDLLLGVTRSFKGFNAVLDEIKNARIVAGIHFRSACDDGQATGVKVANYVLANLLVSAGGDDDDDN